MRDTRDPNVLPGFISTQVTEARRFFLNLKPNRSTPLEIVCGGVERVRADYVVDRADFPYFGIELVAEGKGSLSIHGREYQLSPGVMFAYGPGVAHAIRNRGRDGMSKYYLDFVGTRAKQPLVEAKLMTLPNQYNVVSVGAMHEITELFEMFIRNANYDGPLVSSVCETVLGLLSLKVAQLRLPEGTSVPRSFATFERIRRHIDERYLLLQSIQDVAEECQVTPVYLSSLFGRFSECGAYQYLQRRKMNYAAGLLMNEGLQVQEVAQRLGMLDAFQFSRAFKRVFGIPPSQLCGKVSSDQRT